MVRPGIIKLEEKGSELTDISLGNDFFPFLGWTPKAQVRLNQTEKLLHSTENHQQNETATTEWGKIFANQTSDKGLISKVHKALTQLSSKQSGYKIGRGLE